MAGDDKGMTSASSSALQARLKTLQAAADAGIPFFVAMAPSYPECDENDLRRTLEAIRPLKPLTIFHEPIEEF